jgi:hypothetical protein
MIVKPNPKARAPKARKPISPLKADLTTALQGLDREDYVYQLELIKAHSHNYQGKASVRQRVIVYGKDRGQVQSLLHPLVIKYHDTVQFVFKKWFTGCDVYKGKQVSDYRPRTRY